MNEEVTFRDAVGAMAWLTTYLTQAVSAVFGFACLWYGEYLWGLAAFAASKLCDVSCDVMTIKAELRKGAK